MEKRKQNIEAFTPTEHGRIPSFETDMDERLLRRLEGRHRFAVLARNIEYVDTTDQLKINIWNEAKAGLNLDIPREVKRRFWSALSRLKYRGKAAKKMERYLRRALEMDPDASEADPFEYGEKFFKAYTGASPKGDVGFTQQEGFFAMTISDDKDFLALLEERARQLKKEFKDTMPPHGMYVLLNFHSILKRAGVRSSGRHFIDVTVTSTARNKWRKSDPEQTAIHERQHFINGEILNEFKVTERGYISDRYGHGPTQVKDELLARVRDGSEAKDAYSAHSQGYGHFYSSEEEKDELLAQVQAFTDQLQTSKWFNRKEGREMLVNHLYFEPLEKFTKRIQQLEAYYDVRLKTLNTFSVRDRTDVQRIDTLTHRLYRKQLSKLQRELQDAFDKLQGLFIPPIDREKLALTDLRSAQEITEVVQTFNERIRIFNEQYQSFSALIKMEPSITSTRLRFGSMSEERRRNVGQQYLEALVSMPGSVTQEIYHDALSGNMGQEVASHEWRERMEKALKEQGMDLRRAIVRFVDEKKGLMRISMDVTGKDGKRMELIAEQPVEKDGVDKVE